MRTSAAVAVLVCLSICLSPSAFANVLNMGGTRGPDGSWSGLASLETVPVGDPGNAADTLVMNDGTTGYGSVGYSYNIGKYEVTASQYAEFLNKVAGVDTYGVYNLPMADTSRGSGISRSGGGTPGDPYTYAVAPDCVNRPVNCVSFWDACRFANWLHNGQPAGLEDNSTTENGAYTLTADAMSHNTVVRNADWKWAVTSEDEWYKAAFYKGGSTSAGYWGYPTGTDHIDTGMANYDWSVGHTTDIGSYAWPSPYGTFDQGGNVYEWNEAVINGVNRGLRGASFSDGYSGTYLHASDRHGEGYSPSYEYDWYSGGGFGFRVVQAPEPASLAMLTLGGLLIARRRRDRS